MDWMRVILSRCIAAFRRRRLDSDLDDELSAHIDLAIADNRSRGMTEEQARTAALRAFGGVTQAREAYRMQRGFPWIEQTWRDFRLALRQLRKAPGFAFTSILTLGLGIGAVTSVFSVLYAVLLKPLGFQDPDRLVVMREVVDEMRAEQPSFPDNYRHFIRLKHDAKSLEDAAIFSQNSASVSPDGKHPRIVAAVETSPNLFRLLGVQPVLGREFNDGDTHQGHSDVVLLSDKGWQELFARDPQVVGKTVRVGGTPVSVVGVLPPTLRFPRIRLAAKIESQDDSRDIMLFSPMALGENELKNDTGNFNYKVIARLKPGVSLAQASAELDALQRNYTISAHLPIHLGIALTPLAKDVASEVDGILWLLFAAVGAVLLIACGNLTNLQLARSIHAEREIAVRAALGASRTQLLRARLAESLVLAGIGGAAGIALAFTGVRLLTAFVPPDVPRIDEVQVSLPVLLFATALSIASALLFGTLPALRSVRVPPQRVLQASSSCTANSRHDLRSRNLMVTFQVACTTVLLVITALSLRSFSHLMHLDRGFESGHITLAQVDLFAPQYGDMSAQSNTARIAFAERALRDLGQLPGVQSVGLTSATPMGGETWVDNLGRPDHPVPQAQQPLVNVRFIDPGYLPTLRIPLLAGRNLNAADRTSPYVVLISERTAREVFPAEDPVGKKINSVGPDNEHMDTVVGVVADTRVNGLKNTAPMVYVPYWGFTHWTLSFLVRSSQPSSTLIPELRSTLWHIDPEVAIPKLQAMDDLVEDSMSADRFLTCVLTGFGIAALLLALLGVYGVLAYAVSLRKQEFGIRIALGSAKSALVQMVVRQAAYPVLSGMGIGLGGAFLALRWLRSLLYQSSLVDPVAIGGSMALLLAAAALAAIIPAQRAASIDPMRSLRID